MVVMNSLTKRTITLLMLPLLLGACSKEAELSNTESSNAELSNAELLRNAYLNCIEVTEEKIRPLVTLTKDDKDVIWNEAGDRVLLFTFHRYPDSYPDGQEITFTWGESWLCSVQEYKSWYLHNKDNINDALLRTKQVLGMAEDSQNTYISTMWFDPKDVSRPAYVTDPTKQMKLEFDEGVSEEYKSWFTSQYYYSYETKHLPWTRLGYTYDWSKEAKDRYGLTEFIAWKGTTVKVEKTLTVEQFCLPLMRK